MEDPCIVRDTVDRDPKCDDPVIMYNIRKILERLERHIRNQKLIEELKNLTRSTAPKRHYNPRDRKGRT